MKAVRPSAGNVVHRLARLGLVAPIFWCDAKLNLDGVLVVQEFSRTLGGLLARGGLAAPGGAGGRFLGGGT